MAQSSSPASLESLAVDAVVEWIGDIGLVFTSLENHSPDDLDVQIYVQLYSEELNFLLKHTVPPALINSFTAKLTEHLDNLYIHQYQFLSLEELSNKPVLMSFTRAAIHPALTELDLRSCRMICYVMYLEMYSMKNIVVLKLESGAEVIDFEEMIISGFQEMPLLQILYFHGCTDAILAAIGKTCRYLKCLNVSNSFALKDTGIESFMVPGYLEKFSMVDTTVTEEGVTHIINAMVENVVITSINSSPIRSSLLVTSFGCDVTSASQLSLLVSAFNNIRELKIHALSECDLSVIKHLQFLTSLSLAYCKFVDLQELLLDKGRQLSKLRLVSVEDVDVEVISTKCPALTLLSLKHCLLGSVPSNFGQNVGFPLLEHLYLSDHGSEPSLLPIVCRCPKIKYLKMASSFCRDFESVLNKNAFKNLEELLLQIQLPLEQLRQLLDQCKKLRKMTYNCYKGNDMSNQDEGEYIIKLNDFVKEIKSKHVGLTIKVSSSLWSYKYKRISFRPQH